jgi:diguanylate cyclase (GGDEF)-like protein
MMSLLVILLFAILFLIAVGVILLRKLSENKKKTRGIITDAYRLRSNLSLNQKIADLYRIAFNSFNRITKKSPVLMVAEEFRDKFKLGRFIIYCADKNMLVPFMGLGVRLKSLKALAADEFKQSILSGGDRGSNSATGSAIPLGLNEYQIFSRLVNLPDDFNNPFMIYYGFDNQQVLFLGEDSERNLARNCTSPEFNRAVCTIVTDLNRISSAGKRQQRKIKDLQGGLVHANSQLNDLNQRLKSKVIDLHNFYDVSNRLFTIYDDQRLLESFAESVKSILNSNNVVILVRDEKNKNMFRQEIAIGSANSSGFQNLKLYTSSEMYKLLVSNDRALRLPIISSGLPKPDEFIDKALAGGLLVADKLMIGQDIYAIVLAGLEGERKNLNETDLEAFSTITNMASLALGYINQYTLIEKLSYTDSMTELFNYRYFYKRLNEEIFRAKRFNRMLALVIFDIDNFKTFNDTYGHQAGDDVLRNMAKFVTRSVRAIDIVSRYGGEEFCVIMPDTGFANCLIFIERLRKRVENYQFKSGHVETGYKITVSIGGAIYPNDAGSADRLIYCADMALLKAKAEGRNRSFMFNSSLLDDEKLKNNSQQLLMDMGMHEDIQNN